MKNFWLNFVATLTAAGVIACVGMLWSHGERLAKIETTLSLINLQPQNHVAIKP